MPIPLKSQDLSAKHGQDRMVLEWCCSHESFLGRPCSESRRCGITRLTETEDMTTASGVRYVQAAVYSCSKDTLICIWSDIPCTGGSPYAMPGGEENIRKCLEQNMNRLMPGGEEKLRKHFVCFMKLWDKLVSFLDWTSKGPRPWRLCIEWPKRCNY